MSLADFQQLVISMVRDQADVLQAEDYTRVLDLAVVRYNLDAPMSATVDVTWEATGVSCPAPDGWHAGRRVTGAEFPIGRTPASTIYVDVVFVAAEWVIDSVEVLPAGAVVRLGYTEPFRLVGGDEPADTIPMDHREAVASYAASLLCRQLAAYFSGQRESAVGADASNTESRARNYAARAKEYRAAYYAGINRPDPQLVAAGGGGEAAASAVISMPGRQRHNLVNRGSL